MSQKVEFFFDIASPYSFLAALQVPRLEKLAEVQWRPFLIGGVFKASGNVMPAANPAKGQYMFQDLRRLFAYYGEPFRFPSRFPMNSLQAMRCITALPVTERPAATLKLYRAYWGEDRDLADPAVLGELLGAEVVARASDEAVKAELKETTENAASRGAFGAPTFFVGKDMYFGEDRVFLIEHALAGQKAG
ncbi:MAG: 2-hydroxychromene-2-carboxylate isomerase [Perlucidibaca sp.]